MFACIQSHAHTHTRTRMYMQTDRQTWHQCIHTHALTHLTHLWNWEILFGLQQAFNRIRNRHPKLMGFCLSCCCYYYCSCRCCCHAVERYNSFVNKIQCTNTICWASHAHTRAYNQSKERQKQNTNIYIKWIFRWWHRRFILMVFIDLWSYGIHNIRHI